MKLVPVSCKHPLRKHHSCLKTKWICFVSFFKIDCFEGNYTTRSFHGDKEIRHTDRDLYSRPIFPSGKHCREFSSECGTSLHSKQVTFTCFSNSPFSELLRALVSIKASTGAQPFKWKWVAHSYENQTNSHRKFSFQYLSTKTHFETETNSNSEIAYCQLHLLLMKLAI